MSYSFLTDVFPTWKDGGGSLSDLTSGLDLYENFEAAAAAAVTPPKMPKPVHPTNSSSIIEPDKGLMKESFADGFPLETQRGPGPKPFDETDDYFKLLSEDWYQDTARYQAQARSPFEPKGLAPAFESKEYAEEEQPLATAEAKRGCMNVAQHLDGCKECRSRLEHIFRKITGGAAQQVKSGLQKGGSSLLDIMMLVGIGIFVIFVLDAFVRLGRYLTSD